MFHSVWDAQLTYCPMTPSIVQEAFLSSHCCEDFDKLCFAILLGKEIHLRWQWRKNLHNNCFDIRWQEKITSSHQKLHWGSGAYKTLLIWIYLRSKYRYIHGNLYRSKQRWLQNWFGPLIWAQWLTIQMCPSVDQQKDNWIHQLSLLSQGIYKNYYQCNGVKLY